MQYRFGRLSLFLGILLLVPADASAQAVGPLVLPDSSITRSLRSSGPTRLAERLGMKEALSLDAAEVEALDQLNAMRAWNRAGRRPTQNGFVRPLPPTKRERIELQSVTEAPRRLAGGVIARAGNGDLVWTVQVVVADSHRLRLHLKDVELPAGTKLWVYGGGETVGPFGTELMGPDGDLWTPSVPGPEVTLEAILPEGPGELVIEVDQVAELFAAESSREWAAANVSCLFDARCVGADTLDVIDLYRKAVAQLIYVKGGQSFVCTGALLNDTDDTTVIPYLLTANHCLSTQQVAATLEATWDWTTNSCEGSAPPFSGLPRSSGSTLLATSLATDFTLVRLTSIPPGRVLLGWNANPNAIGAGTILHRLSHPAPDGLPFPQGYSQAVLEVAPGTCGGSDEEGRPLDDPTYFFKSRPLVGGTFGGSSGAPVILPRGIVVGQLFGGCGSNPEEGCGGGNWDVDGAFSATFPAISQFLSPQSGGGDTSPCSRSAETACLQGGRFEVKVSWNNGSGNGTGKIMSFGGQRTENDESAFYSFQAATNFEMGVKMLDACIPLFGDKFWVFISGLTDQGWDVTVRDTATGAVRTYSNTPGQLSKTFADTSAFDC